MTRKAGRAKANKTQPTVGSSIITNAAAFSEFGSKIDPFASVPRKEKKFSYSWSDNQQLYHSTPNRFPTTDLIGAITTGSTFNTRIGNSIRLRELDLRLWISNKSDRPNVLYRLSVLALPNSTAQAFSDCVLSSSGNPLLWPIDPNKAMILFDKPIVSNPGGPIALTAALAASKERSYCMNARIPINKTVSWAASGTTQRTFLYVYLTAYDAFGTLTTDNIASYSYTTTLFFDDD